MTSTHPVVVVGGGISGIAAARAVAAAGLPVKVLDRGRKLGGRMACRTEDSDAGPRRVDVGASYFTAKDERFLAVVEDWQARGLARRWTDTFHLATPEGRAGTTTGPVRWAGTQGLRSLVEDLASGLDVTHENEVGEVGTDADGRPHVDGEQAAAVVLAMPDPQASDLLPEDVAKDLGVTTGDSAPTIAVWARWTRPWWPRMDGAFVDGSPVVSWVADDGARRGDGAPVLVAHTTAVFAAAHLDDPGLVVEPVLAELPALLGADCPEDPEYARVHRWSLAAPRTPHDEPFGLHESLVGVCGDGWGAKPRVEQAWLSGHLLGTELARRLAS